MAYKTKKRLEEKDSGNSSTKVTGRSLWSDEENKEKENTSAISKEENDLSFSGNGVPPLTQAEADISLKDSFDKDFRPAVNVGGNLNYNADGREQVKQAATYASQSISLTDIDKENMFRVVEYTIFERDPGLINSSNPEGEIANTRETVVIVEDEFRSTDPLFKNPGRNEKPYGYVTNVPSPNVSKGLNTIDANYQYRIVFTFQLAKPF